MIKDLDQEADRLGVTRQTIIKVWLAERLQSLSSASVLDVSRLSVSTTPRMMPPPRPQSRKFIPALTEPADSPREKAR
jgi:hypothetical protein